jgi:hypothetical protein
MFNKKNSKQNKGKISSQASNKFNFFQKKKFNATFEITINDLSLNFYSLFF